MLLCFIFSPSIYSLQSKTANKKVGKQSAANQVKNNFYKYLVHFRENVFNENKTLDKFEN